MDVVGVAALETLAVDATLAASGGLSRLSMKKARMATTTSAAPTLSFGESANPAGGGANEGGVTGVRVTSAIADTNRSTSWSQASSRR